MAPGDVGRVSFDGSIAFGLGLTYGLGSFQFSAPGVDAVQAALRKGFETLTLPAVAVDAGITAHGSYTHADHFGAIVLKTGASTAMLYLVRSSDDEIGGDIGVKVGVTVSPLQATLDQTALANAINGVTGAYGDKAAALADQLQSSLVSRTNHWLSTVNGDIGLLVQLGQHKNRTLLYEFQVDLSNPDVTRQSWEKLAEADVSAAMQIGGLTLVEGSGVHAALRRSVRVGLHFFNFFSASEKDTYFRNATTEVGPHGSIRYLFDIGNERDIATKHALATSRVHFVADATSADPNRLEGVEVKLVVELSETNKAKDGKAIASALGDLADAAAAQGDMEKFVGANPKGTLTLAAVLKPSAYGRLAGADPDRQDRTNWQAFHDAVMALDGSLGPRIANLRYEDWELFNQYAVNGDPPSGTPDRRMVGNPAAVPETFYDDRGLVGIGPLAAYFLVASQRTMNLFDGLQALAEQVKVVDTPAAWNALLTQLTALSRQLESDWTRPVLRALLERSSAGAGVQADVRADPASNALTCTVTVS
jgi:hypothetical protein